MPDEPSSEEHTGRPWDDRDVLYELYHEKEMSQREIAETLGCNRSTVHKSMVRNDVSRRSRRVERANFRTQQHGYEIWEVRVGDHCIQCRVHQLLAISDGEDPQEVFSEDTEIHHKNGVPWDNREGNIELLSASEHSRITARERWS